MRGRYRLGNIRLHIHTIKDWLGCSICKVYCGLEGGGVLELGTDLSLKSRQGNQISLIRSSKGPARRLIKHLRLVTSGKSTRTRVADRKKVLVPWLASQRKKV